MNEPITFSNGPLPVEILSEEGELILTVLPYKTVTLTLPDERSRRNLLADFALIEYRQRIVEMLDRRRRVAELVELVKASS